MIHWFVINEAKCVTGGTFTANILILPEFFYRSLLLLFFFQIKLLCPEPGFVEIDPAHLWEKLIHTIKRALEGSF